MIPGSRITSKLKKPSLRIAPPSAVDTKNCPPEETSIPEAIGTDVFNVARKVVVTSADLWERYCNSRFQAYSHCR